MIDLMSYEKRVGNNKPTNIKNISAGQIRAARALIRWTAEDLSANASLGIATIRRAELTEGPLRMTASNLAAVRRTLEEAGIEFIFENGGGPGVRLRKPQ